MLKINNDVVRDLGKIFKNMKKFPRFCCFGEENHRTQRKRLALIYFKQNMIEHSLDIMSEKISRKEHESMTKLY